LSDVGPAFTSEITLTLIIILLPYIVTAEVCKKNFFYQWLANEK
jgi:hypothetical protein